MTPRDQAAHGIRVDWGARGARELVAGGVAQMVVVDVLSFTTSVGVAVSRGMTVRPHPWHDRSGPELAARLGAACAVGRAVAGPGDVSLSPMSIAAAEGLSRLVLPSPNGSAICSELADAGVDVAAASVRTASAVGRWLADRPDGTGIVAAGERWSGDGSLRPAVEDLWGAGAVVDALLAHRPDAGPSPEAEAARAAWRSAPRTSPVGSPPARVGSSCTRGALPVMWRWLRVTGPTTWSPYWPTAGSWTLPT
ncbi:MAG: 2-phosphosulfolactate phosphatase, partial [Phycicoccus sp.]